MKEQTKKKLFELIEFAKKNKLAEVAWQEGGVKISFRRGLAVPPLSSKKAANAPSSTAQPDALPSEIIRSPIVGTFRRSSSKNRPPLIMKGNKVKVGDRLGVVECMKIPTEVISFCSGEIKDVLVEEGQPVEYGQPLFSIELHKNGKSSASGKES